MYEYDGMNGDYICEELVHELSETAWIHLHRFLVLYQIKYGTDNPEDVMLRSTVQLQHLGESDWWQPYLGATYPSTRVKVKVPICSVENGLSPLRLSIGSSGDVSSFADV